MLESGKQAEGVDKRSQSCPARSWLSCILCLLCWTEHVGHWGLTIDYRPSTVEPSPCPARSLHHRPPAPALRPTSCSHPVHPLHHTRRRPRRQRRRNMGGKAATAWASRPKTHIPPSHCGMPYRNHPCPTNPPSSRPPTCSTAMPSLSSTQKSPRPPPPPPTSPPA